MAFQPTIPFPVAIWDEHPLQVAATPLTTLIPWKTTAGYWVLLPAGIVGPSGAVRGALVHGASYDTLLSSTTAGLRQVRNSRGFVFSY